MKPSESQSRNKEENNFQEYPIYPDSEDIYTNFKEEDINPEDFIQNKRTKEQQLLGTPAKAKNYLQQKNQIYEQKQNEESLLDKLTGQH